METAEQPAFSVQKDIEPLRERYFRGVMSNPNLNPRAAANLSLRYSAGSDAIADEADKRKMRDMQMESATMSLEREREKAARERGMLQQLAPFQKQLESVLSDPNMDPATKQKSLSQLGVANAGLISTNEGAGVAFQSAFKGVGEDPTLVKPKTTAAHFISAGGSYDVLDAYAKKQGIKLGAETELPFDVFAAGLDYTKQKTAQGKTDEKVALKREKENDDRIKGLVTAVQKVELSPVNPLDPSKLDENKFATPMDDALVGGVISTFATPEERDAVAKGNAKIRLELAQRLTGEYLSGKRGVAPPAAEVPSATDLFK
jgi:hypothetical protein